MTFLYDKKVVVKRVSSTLGEYNRPTKTTILVGTYECLLVHGSSNTAQLQPQKKNTTDLTIYVDPDTPIVIGDILYIYEVDEYGELIESSVLKAIADRPYKKRTQLSVSLLSEVEE